MDILKKHVDMLGLKVKDKVTGFEGVVGTIGFDLYGCVQAVIQPYAKDGDLKDARWFDVNRLEVVDRNRVMPIPSFVDLASKEGVHEKGPADKPARRQEAK